jgi:serine/threonine-protein kinase RsbT
VAALSTLEERLIGALREAIGAVLSRSIVTLGVARAKVNPAQIRPDDEQRLFGELKRGLQLFVKEPERRELCLDRLRQVLASIGPTKPLPERIAIDLLSESDIVKARGAGRDLCRDLGFTGAVQIKVATAISELARNAVQYARSGVVTITALAGKRAGIEVVVHDQGPGITDLDQILAGNFHSKSGMGIGLVGTRNLMDEFEIETAPGRGTVVTMRKYIR